MSENTTIARPYAKAVFDHALNAEKLEVWSSLLEGFSLVSADKNAHAFLENPSATIEQRANLFEVIIDRIKAGDETAKARNFVFLLAENGRLGVLQNIWKLYEQLRSEHEKTLEVTVRTFTKLNETQKTRLMHSLENRLKRKIMINEVLDHNLLGGAIIQAGDFVIDGSVKGKLNKLAASLAA